MRAPGAWRRALLRPSVSHFRPAHALRQARLHAYSLIAASFPGPSLLEQGPRRTVYPPFLQYASLNRSPESTAPSAQAWSGLGGSAGAGPCRRAACFDRHDPCFLWTVGVGANRRSYAFAFPICAFGPAKAAPPLWQPQLAVHDSKLDRLGARARAGTGVPRDDSDEPRRLNGWARWAGGGKRQQRQRS